MTDHRIQRRKPAGDSLAPFKEKTGEQQTYRGEVVLYYPEAGLDPAARDLYLGIAQVKEKANLRAGVKLLSRAIENEPGRHARPYFELAEAQAALGRHDQARRNYLEAIKRDTSFVQAYNNLANLLSDMGEAGAAFRHFQKALDLDPLSADILTNFGLARLDNGESDDALRMFREAAAANPMYAEARFNLGSLLLSRGSFSEAEQALKLTLAIEPSHVKARYNLGLVLLGLDRREEAAGYLNYAIRHGDSQLRESAKKYLSMTE